MVDEEYDEALEEAEPVEYGFKSKTTEMAKGRVNIKGERIKEKKKRMRERGMMHPPRKPGIARYIPKPIAVRREGITRSIIGIPAGHGGLRPVDTRFRPPASIFGKGKAMKLL